MQEPIPHAGSPSPWAATSVTASPSSARFANARASGVRRRPHSIVPERWERSHRAERVAIVRPSVRTRCCTGALSRTSIPTRCCRSHGTTSATPPSGRSRGMRASTAGSWWLQYFPPTSGRLMNLARRAYELLAYCWRPGRPWRSRAYVVAATYRCTTRIDTERSSVTPTPLVGR
jgi:hypothetical protein